METLQTFQQLAQSLTSFQQFLQIEPKSVSESGDFSATVLTMGEFNRKGNLFVQGAFDDWLQTDPKVPTYFQHDNTLYIGIWDNFRLSGNELLGDGHLFVNNDQFATETAWKIRQGFLTAVSAGGGADRKDVMIVDRVLPDGELGYGVVYSKAYLVEASVVVNPGDENALIKQDFKQVMDECFKGIPKDQGLSVEQIMTHDPAKQTDTTDTTEADKEKVIDFSQVVTPVDGLDWDEAFKRLQ